MTEVLFGSMVAAYRTCFMCHCLVLNIIWTLQVSPGRLHELIGWLIVIILLILNVEKFGPFQSKKIAISLMNKCHMVTRKPFTKWLSSQGIFPILFSRRNRSFSRGKIENLYQQIKRECPPDKGNLVFEAPGISLLFQEVSSIKCGRMRLRGSQYQNLFNMLYWAEYWSFNLK